MDAIQTLQDFFADRPRVSIPGNLLLYYEEGNPRKHVSPDVLVALGVPREPLRDHYLVWKEGKAPDFVAEITTKTTKREDEKKKFVIYRDLLKVTEYVLFDPRADYLDPPLQGFRLVGGDYAPIEPIAGRLSSPVLGLHLEHDGQRLRLFDPSTGRYLVTRLERQEAADRRAETADHRAKEERRRAEEECRRADAAIADQRRLAEENERLRREIEALRGR